MTIIVGLHGLPRTGKDTFAQYLVEKFGFVRVAFADALYQEVAECFGVTVAELQSDVWKRMGQDKLMGWKAQDPDYRQRLKAIGTDLFEPQTSRFHLQRYSTEYKRAENDSYWMDILQGAIARMPASQNIVVSDVRFPIESGMLARLAATAKAQYTLIEITREGTTPTGHVSDQHLGDMISKSFENINGQPELMFIAATAFIREINGSNL